MGYDTNVPGASVSYSPQRSFFERLETFQANLNSRDFSVRRMRLVNLG